MYLTQINATILPDGIYVEFMPYLELPLNRTACSCES